MALVAVLGLMVVTCIDGRNKQPPISAPAATAVATVPTSLNRPMYAKTTANCRRDASAGSPVIGKLFNGQSAMAIVLDGMFYRVQLPNGTTCHIASRLLSDMPPPTRLSRPPRSRPARASAYVDDGYCPCSGYRDCTGPRGGTYCYTSGGRKRYR